jgi:hypothetical protein
MNVAMAAVLAVGLAAGEVDLAEAKKAGAAAAEQWVTLVDAGKFDEAWKAAAPTFRSGVTSEDWSKKIREAREPLGAASGRRLAATRFSETLPGAPDAHYVVATYATDFANRKAASETIVTVKDGGGWKVAGYWIQ